MNVPLLKSFDETDWTAVRAAFQGAPVLPFLQGWRETLEPEFRGGEVRLGWTEAGLWVFAQMEDESLFTRATADNQPMWTLGDVFEIFVRDLAGEEYLELHTTPNGHRLQLRFASERIFSEIKARRLKLEEMKVTEPLFRSHVRTVPGGWEVLACVTAVKGRTLRASFSRYDYRDAETAPVLSSTSAHREIHFHGQDAWRDFRLVDYFAENEPRI